MGFKEPKVLRFNTMQWSLQCVFLKVNIFGNMFHNKSKPRHNHDNVPMEQKLWKTSSDVSYLRNSLGIAWFKYTEIALMYSAHCLVHYLPHSNLILCIICKHSIWYWNSQCHTHNITCEPLTFCWGFIMVLHKDVFSKSAMYLAKYQS